MAERKLTEREKLDIAGAARAAYLQKNPGDKVTAIIVGSFTDQHGQPKVTIEVDGKPAHA